MNEIPLLTFGAGDGQRLSMVDGVDSSVDVDIHRLIASRLLIQANSGGGKSRALRSLLEQTHGNVQHIIFDPEGEFASLREKFPYLLAGRDGGEVPTDPRSARLLCRRLMNVHVSAILDLYDLSLADRRRFVRYFLEELMRLPRDLWRPLIVVIDEAHVFCPERGAGDSESTEAVITLCTQGRKRGYCAVLATQRIAKLHKDAAAELLNKLIGRTGLDVDVRRASEELGFDKEERSKLKFLTPGTFYAFGPAIANGNEVRLVRTGEVSTSHPELGMVSSVPPPTPEAIQSLMAQFADLPADATQEYEDIEAAKLHIVNLEQFVAAMQLTQVEIGKRDASRDEKAQASVSRIQGSNGSQIMDAYNRLTYVAHADLNLHQGDLDDGASRVTSGIKVEVADAESIVGQMDASAQPLPAPRFRGESQGDNGLSHALLIGIMGGLSTTQRRMLCVLADLEALGKTDINPEALAYLSGQSPNYPGFQRNLLGLVGIHLVDSNENRSSLSDLGRTIIQSMSGVPSERRWSSILSKSQFRMIKQISEKRLEGTDLLILASSLGQSASTPGFLRNVRLLEQLALIEIRGRFAFPLDI